KSIAVDGRVNVTIPCITQGDVKINGWERDEVRVFIKGGSPVSFGVKQKSQKSDKPVWIWLSSFSKEGDMPAVRSDCIWGDEIQIDAPMGAEITMKGRETNTVVDSVRKATVTNGGGALSVTNISEGVSAK